MVGNTLAQELANYVQSMHDQGVLDAHFDHLKQMQNEENPHFIADVIAMFRRDSAFAIAQMTEAMSAPTVDFVKFLDGTHQLKGSSSGVGGGRMAFLCCQLRDAAVQCDARRCYQLFERAKQEHSILRNCLDNIAQMEANILANEIRRRRG